MNLKTFLNSKKNTKSVGVFILFLALVICFFRFNVGYNEMDVVPYARAIYDSDWLAKDWYLSLVIPYRFFFSYIVGFFATTFGFIKTIVFGRLITYFLIAFSLNHLITSLKADINRLFFYTVLFLFFKFFPYGIGAGEWIVGGLDTKVFAYFGAILSLSFLLRKKYIHVFFFAGLSLSFHLLVGIYNLFCLFPIVIYYLVYKKASFIKLLKAFSIFFLSGSIGLFGIFNHFFNGVKKSNLGWDIYVNIRVPHHTFPSLMTKDIWYLIVLLTIINFFFFLKFKKEEVKLITLYAFFSVLISMIGVIVFFTLETHYLRYYFFRTCGVILPLITFLNIAFVLGGKIKEYTIAKMFKIKHVYFLIVTVLLIAKLVSFMNDFSLNIKANSTDDIEMVEWVKENTNKEDVFISRPNDKSFHINYERALFVSWKLSPQASTDIEEWYHRLKLLNSGKDFKKLKEVQEGYLNLSEQDILKITKNYKNIGYILMSNDKELDFPILYQTDKNTLYKI